MSNVIFWFSITNLDFKHELKQQNKQKYISPLGTLILYHQQPSILTSYVIKTMMTPLPNPSIMHWVIILMPTHHCLSGDLSKLSMARMLVLRTFAEKTWRAWPLSSFSWQVKSYQELRRQKEFLSQINCQTLVSFLTNACIHWRICPHFWVFLLFSRWNTWFVHGHQSHQFLRSFLLAPALQH